MRVLITGSNGKLGSALVRALGATHDVRTLDLVSSESGVSDYVGDPRDPEVAVRATQGCNAIIHLSPLVASGALPIDVLDAATRGTFNLIRSATTASRFVLASSLRIFERYPSEWRINELWRPQPTTDMADLAPYLAEITARELSYELPLKIIGLRLGNIIDDAEIKGQTPDPRWVHVEDVVQAFVRALAFEPAPDEPKSGWWVYHIPGAGNRTRFSLELAGTNLFGYEPQHDLTQGIPLPIPTAKYPEPVRFTNVSGGTARKVVIFGACSRLSSVTAEALARDHVLRLTDNRPLEEVALHPPSRPDLPKPRLLGSPHETRITDISDPEQVFEASRDMEAIINCTVVRGDLVGQRGDLVGAFKVNTLGCYNLMQAAVKFGIRRIVQTGPLLTALQKDYLHQRIGFWHDYYVVDDTPPRVGNHIYGISKLLGNEICRVFAAEHDLEVPILLFDRFVDPRTPTREPLGDVPFSVSWEDSALAMRQALHAPSFPHPVEVIHINADMPHGRYPNEKAKRLLGWQPRDRFESHWMRDLK